MNDENLKGKGFHERTAEEQRKIATAGGKASGEARRKKKAMREQMEMLLSLKAKPEELKTKMRILGIDTDNMDNQMALITALYAEALKGDVGAFNSIRDLIGEKPIEQISVEHTTDRAVKEMESYMEKWEKEQEKITDG